MINIRPPGNEYVLYSLGIGRVLSSEEKTKLPKNILDEINSYYEIRKQYLHYHYDYVVIALAELYNVSVFYNPNESGTYFLVKLGTKSKAFEKLKNIGDSSSENFYINISPMSLNYVLFHRDKRGKYKVIRKGVAG